MKLSLLLVPGLLCDSTIWSAQLAALRDQEVIAVPGFGATRRIGDMADQLLALAPERFALAGHSMGARVALEVCARAPERVERLALLDTGVHPVRPGEAEKRRALLELGKRDGIAALVDAWLPPMLHRRDPAIVAPLRAMCIAAGLESYEAQIEALLSRPDPLPLLPRIRCPVLVGVGRQDQWSPVAQHQEIAATIPNATLAVFEQCGHMAPFEAPDQVTAALRRWLEQPVFEGSKQ